MGVTFVSVESAIERAVYAFDFNASRLNSDSDTRGILYFFTFFVLVIMISIFTQTLPISLALRFDTSQQEQVF